MLEIMAPEPYFVDFLREAPEPTGEEPDDAVLEAPKIYELVTETSYLILILLKLGKLSFNNTWQEA